MDSISKALKHNAGADTVDSNEEWFALQVTPRHEFTTAKILRLKGFQEFVPTYTSRRKWSDREKNVVLPLFTGYVFAKLCLEAKLPIVTTPGVIRIVGSRKGPIPIPQEQLEMARKASACARHVQPYPYIPDIPGGTRVRINDGPLAGVEGTFHGYDRSELIVSVDIIQRSMRIGIERCSLSVLPSAEAGYQTTPFVPDLSGTVVPIPIVA
jgi:transcription termination/antitermination protein NusG